MDDYLSFDDNEAGPYPYSRVLVISMPIAGVTIPRVLYWERPQYTVRQCAQMDGYSCGFLQSYINVILGLNKAMTRATGSMMLIVEAEEAPQQVKAEC